MNSHGLSRLLPAWVALALLGPARVSSQAEPFAQCRDARELRMLPMPSAESEDSITALSWQLFEVLTSRGLALSPEGLAGGLRSRYLQNPTLSEAALANIVVNEELFGADAAERAAVSYRILSGQAGPILRRMADYGRGFRAGWAFHALRPPLAADEEAAVLAYACDAAIIARWLSDTHGNELQLSSTSAFLRRLAGLADNILSEAARVLSGERRAALTAYIEHLK